jgi:hypothetical protein
MVFWRRKPRVHYYAPAWNEAAMLPFMIRHYSPWVDRFVIFDSDSTDESVELLRRIPKVEVRRLEWACPDSTIDTLRHMANTCWKESRGTADWVIVADIDEFLYHPDMLGYLGRWRNRGVTCIPALGYEMVSDSFPEPDETLADTRRLGLQQRMMNKLRLFRPDAIEETNFGHGAHVAKPTGRVVYPKVDEVLLLHYKWLGPEYLIRRHAAMETTRRSVDVANNWSRHYDVPAKQLKADLDKMLAGAVDVRALGDAAWRDHKEDRWWRQRRGKKVAKPA